MRIPDKAFAQFVVSRGAELLEATNEWEVLRFRSKDGIGVVYKNKYDQRTYTGTAIEAKKAYQANNPTWNVDKVKRKPMSDKRRLLLSRDGAYCFYCGKMTTEENRTIEHLLSIADGGTNMIGNLALSHDTCNFMARNLSLVEKVKLRDKLRAQDDLLNKIQTVENRLVKGKVIKTYRLPIFTRLLEGLRKKK